MLATKLSVVWAIEEIEKRAISDVGLVNNWLGKDFQSVQLLHYLLETCAIPLKMNTFFIFGDSYAYKFLNNHRKKSIQNKVTKYFRIVQCQKIGGGVG